jgi:hypothetical protein
MLLAQRRQNCCAAISSRPQARQHDVVRRETQAASAARRTMGRDGGHLHEFVIKAPSCRLRFLCQFAGLPYCIACDACFDCASIKNPPGGGLMVGK